MKRSEIEKRLQTRYSPSLYISVFEGSDDDFFGLLADLSSTGFKLSTGNETEKGKVYRFSVKNPFSGRGGELNYFRAEQVWCKNSDDGLLESGFQFAGYEGESEKLFKRLIIDFESTARSMNKLEGEDLLNH